MPRRSTEPQPETVEDVAPDATVEAEESATDPEGFTEDQRRAAEKRAAAHADAEGRDPYIGALLDERRGYVVRGLDDRVAQVDEQLALRGYQP